jgi:hypothetical protein
VARDRHQSNRPNNVGHLRPLISAVASAIPVVILCIVSFDAAASGSLPVSPRYLQATSAYNGLQVKPSTITYTGDGTGLLAGAVARNQRPGIHWTRWTAAVALGTGFNQLNDCNPYCARGKFRGYPVKIELWHPQVVVDTLVFTRMTIFYTKSRPRGEPRHYTFTDTYTGSGYGWGPPDEQGYCVHTYGMRPAAGCKNIHTLP